MTDRSFDNTLSFFFQTALAEASENYVSLIFDGLLDGLSDGVVAVNRDGHVVASNAAVRRLLSHYDDSSDDLHIDQLVTGAGGVSVLKFAEVMTGEAFSSFDEIRFSFERGDDHPVSFRLSAFEGDQGFLAIIGGLPSSVAADEEDNIANDEREELFEDVSSEDEFSEGDNDVVSEDVLNNDDTEKWVEAEPAPEEEEQEPSEQSAVKNTVEGEQPATEHEIQDVKRVLFAENKQDEQLLVTDMLERAGYGIDVVQNGAEAINAARQTSYDAVLMNISLPVLGGIEATKAILNNDLIFVKPAIIAVTPHLTKEEQQEFLASGFSAVIGKPLIEDHVLGALEAVIAERTDPGQEPDIDGEIAVKDRIFDKQSFEVNWGGISATSRDLLAQQFISDLKRQRLKLEGAMRDESFVTVQRAAHVLRSLAGTKGAIAVENHALTLIEKTKTEDVAFRDLLGSIMNVVTSVDDTIKAFPAMLDRLRQEKSA